MVTARLSLKEVSSAKNTSFSSNSFKEEKSFSNKYFLNKR